MGVQIPARCTSRSWRNAGSCPKYGRNNATLRTRWRTRGRAISTSARKQTRCDGRRSQYAACTPFCLTALAVRLHAQRSAAWNTQNVARNMRVTSRTCERVGLKSSQGRNKVKRRSLPRRRLRQRRRIEWARWSDYCRGRDHQAPARSCICSCDDGRGWDWKARDQLPSRERQHRGREKHGAEGRAVVPLDSDLRAH